MYIDVYRYGKKIRVIDKTLSSISWENELMYVPQTNLTLPITEKEYFSGFEEVKIVINGKVFWGIVTGINIDNEQETIDLSIKHIINEWTYRQISVNNAIKDKSLNFVYKRNADRLVEDLNTGESICANNITLTENRELSLSELISDRYCFVQAWDTKTFSEKKIVKFTKEVDTEKYKPTEEHSEPPKDFILTFYTIKGTKISVNETIVKDYKSTYSTEFDIPNASVMETIENIGNDKNFAYEGWTLSYSPQEASQRQIDYVYSRQNKLDALTKTCELTDDLYWRVRFVDKKEVQISPFGDVKPYVISVDNGLPNIPIISEPTIEIGLDNIVNLATVYSDKSNSGMSSLTLREVYERPELQKDGFPVVILRANVNNERDYTKFSTQFPVLAPNNELEYAVVSEDCIRIENGRLIEGTFAFNDLNPFSVDNVDGTTKVITDEDRIKTALTTYERSIKILKNSVRRIKINVTVGELPLDVNVGDRIHFRYLNIIKELEKCGSFYKKLVNLNDLYYITRINTTFNENETETNELVLEKYLITDRNTRYDAR